MTGELLPQLATVIGELDLSTAAAQSLAASVDDATFARPPGPGRWCAAECIEHLTLTNKLYYPVVTELLARGRTMPRTNGPYRRRLIGAVLAWSLEPGRGAKSRTIPSTVPHVTAARNAVVEDFAASQEVIKGFIRESSGMDLRQLVMSSPFAKRVRYDMYSLWTILASHARRHIVQAQKAARGE